MAVTSLTDQFTVLVDAIQTNSAITITTTRALRVVSAQAIISGNYALPVILSKVASGGGTTTFSATGEGNMGTAMVQGNSVGSIGGSISIFGPNSTLLESDNLRVENPASFGVPSSALQAVIFNCIGSPAATWTTT